MVFFIQKKETFSFEYVLTCSAIAYTQCFIQHVEYFFVTNEELFRVSALKTKYIFYGFDDIIRYNTLSEMHVSLFA